MRLTKKIIAMCFAVGMTLMPMGQAFANEEGETLVETTNVQQDEAPEMMSESEVASEAEKVIECEEETVSEGTLYNERSSLSREECEQIQEEISQIERPENYLEGDFTNYSECSSYLRNQMSLRYNYVMFNLYSSTYHSLSAMETMNNTIFNNVFVHTGVSYQGDAILYDYEGVDWEVTRYALGNGRYRYEFFYIIVYKNTTQQELDLRTAIQNKTADCLYAVPLMLEEEGLAREVCNHLKLDRYIPDNRKWEEMIEKIRKIDKNNKVKIAIVGKYIKLEDSYISVIESIKHAGFANDVETEIKLIDAEKITKDTADEMLKEFQGIVVPGGFGNRGIEGKIETIKYARENKIPFLGICLGMQMAVVEYARDVLGLKDANSQEFDEKSKNQVIHIMENQKSVNKKGGTMRLGSYPCVIKEGTLAEKVYGTTEIAERHRHRFEYNNDYKERLENAGLICSGTSPDGELVEIVELSQKEHPFFIAGQFHPELKSRPNKPAPLFVELVKVAKTR